MSSLPSPFSRFSSLCPLTSPSTSSFHRYNVYHFFIATLFHSSYLYAYPGQLRSRSTGTSKFERDEHSLTGELQTDVKSSRFRDNETKNGNGIEEVSTAKRIFVANVKKIL